MTKRSKLISAFEKIKGYSSDMFDCETWIEFDGFISGTEYALEIAAEKAKIKRFVRDRDSPWKLADDFEDETYLRDGLYRYDVIDKKSIINCLK